jgi:transcriptional regulator with XRE-family HTH domain
VNPAPPRVTFNSVTLYAQRYIAMQQPELGRRLTTLRKERNLTQEELVEKSHVSVRTIQRIEAGEVMPRISTVKILLDAMGEPHDQFFNTKSTTMHTNTFSGNPNRNTMLIAAICGIMYLVLEVIMSFMDIVWLTDEDDWSTRMNLLYSGLSVLTVITYALFVRGFIVLAKIFENSLLHTISYILVIAMAANSILDISTLSVRNIESLWIPYAGMALLFGALSILFGVALIRLQDGMGELSRMAGLLEIVMGATLATVILFFVSYVILVPAVIVEILVLFRGYEYLSRAEITPGEMNGITPAG